MICHFVMTKIRNTARSHNIRGTYLLPYLRYESLKDTKIKSYIPSSDKGQNSDAYEQIAGITTTSEMNYL